MSIRHFHHVGLSVPDVPVQKKFYEDFGLIGTETENRTILRFLHGVMGMKLSDTSGGLIAFLGPPGGSDHHTVAFLETERPGFHHASFEVDDVDIVGLGGQGMLEKGYRNGWGLGRHALGSNFFWYIRDPHGGLCEYFADIDYIADDDAWQPQDWPIEVGFYLWGPNPPEEFGMNFEGARTTTKPSSPSKGART